MADSKTSIHKGFKVSFERFHRQYKGLQGAILEGLFHLKIKHCANGAKHMSNNKDLQFEVSDGFCEVIITDVTENEYVYWVKITDLNDKEDFEDEAIRSAVVFHKSTVGTDVAIDDEGVQQALASEAFSRLADEFTWVDLSSIKS